MQALHVIMDRLKSLLQEVPSGWLRQLGVTAAELFSVLYRI